MLINQSHYAAMKFRATFEFLLKLVLGAGVAAIGCALLVGILGAILAPIGFAIAFVAPLLVLGLFITTIPAIGVVIAGFTKPERIPYAIGAIAAVGVQIAIPFFAANAVENTIQQRLALQQIQPLSRPPEFIVLDCTNCYGMENSLLASTTQRIVVFRRFNPRSAFELVRIPASQCDINARDIWELNLVANGHIEWCVHETPFGPVTDGLVFRFNEHSHIEAMKDFNGWRAEVVELSAGIEREITYWENGSVHVEGSLPFGVPRNVEIGEKYLQPYKLFEAVLKVSPLNLVQENPNRNIEAEIQLAFRFLKTVNRNLGSEMLFHYLFSTANAQKQKEIIYKLRERLVAQPDELEKEKIEVLLTRFDK
ncbi:MAG: hypothetical protein KBF54_09505 [Rhizobiales bacterium]|nr:hypothetical protein [Hyphomicrobiales bacterium]MBP9174775.1 hypothetical protein [Hyphomicrobiales bacterium]